MPKFEGVKFNFLVACIRVGVRLWLEASRMSGGSLSASWQHQGLSFYPGLRILPGEESPNSIGRDAV